MSVPAPGRYPGAGTYQHSHPPPSRPKATLMNAIPGAVADRRGQPTPEQLALPPELLAAMTLPAPIPSARRRGRPVHSTPDISNYQPEETR